MAHPIDFMSKLASELGRDRSLRDYLDGLPLHHSGDCSVEGNLRLVPVLVARYFGLAPALDLIQEGNIGLMAAAARYTPARGAFADFAAFWVLSYARRLVSQERPWETRRMAVLRRKVRRADNDDDAALAATLHVPLAKVQAARQPAACPVALVSVPEQASDEQIFDEELDALRQALGSLSVAEQAVLDLDIPIRELAQQLHTGPVQALKRRRAALAKLKAVITEQDAWY